MPQLGSRQAARHGLASFPAADDRSGLRVLTAQKSGQNRLVNGQVLLGNAEFLTKLVALPEKPCSSNRPVPINCLDFNKRAQLWHSIDMEFDIAEKIDLTLFLDYDKNAESFG